MAEANPTAPEKNKTCQRLFEGLAHQTQKRTTIPVVQIAPPNPARSCAIRGISLGLIARMSTAGRPINCKSCETKTFVMPTIITVKPPAIIPVAVASKSARPIPNGENHGTLVEDFVKEEKRAGVSSREKDFTRPPMKKGMSSKVHASYPDSHNQDSQENSQSRRLR